MGGFINSTKAGIIELLFEFRITEEFELLLNDRRLVKK